MTVYKRALYAWGIEPQMLKTVEELSELQKSISRFLILRCIGRGEKIAHDKEPEYWDSHENTKNVVEEIVDVEIMINQLKEYFDENVYNSYRVEKMIKLERLLTESETG